MVDDDNRQFIPNARNTTLLQGVDTEGLTAN